jgi:hypothetical protein
MNSLLTEEWKPIKNYEGFYEISNHGSVKSLKRFGVKKDRILKPTPNTQGYLMVKLCVNGNNNCFTIHRLVWENFGNKEKIGNLTIDHIDNNKLNNRIDNLQLLTCRENISKCYRETRKTTSKYTGVCFDKKSSKWEASITINKRKKSLGYFKSEYQASLVYQKALKNL